MGKKYPARKTTCPFRCMRKRQYDTAEMALEDNKNYVITYGGHVLIPYQCNHCKKWHLSKDEERQFTGRKKRK
jgi:hypothetical protein